MIFARTKRNRVRHLKILCLVVILWTSSHYYIRATDFNDTFEILIFGHFDHFWPLGRSKVVIFKKLSNIIDQGLIRGQIERCKLKNERVRERCKLKKPVFYP